MTAAPGKVLGSIEVFSDHQKRSQGSSTHMGTATRSMNESPGISDIPKRIQVPAKSSFFSN